MKLSVTVKEILKCLIPVLEILYTVLIQKKSTDIEKVWYPKPPVSQYIAFTIILATYGNICRIYWIIGNHNL